MKYICNYLHMHKKKDYVLLITKWTRFREKSRVKLEDKKIYIDLLKMKHKNVVLIKNI